jgi:hypothetical protein
MLNLCYNKETEIFFFVLQWNAFHGYQPKKENKKRTLIKSHAWTIYKLWAFSNGLFQLIEAFEWTHQTIDKFNKNEKAQ